MSLGIQNKPSWCIQNNNFLLTVPLNAYYLWWSKHTLKNSWNENVHGFLLFSACFRPNYLGKSVRWNFALPITFSQFIPTLFARIIWCKLYTINSINSSTYRICLSRFVSKKTALSVYILKDTKFSQYPFIKIDVV